MRTERAVAWRWTAVAHWAMYLLGSRAHPPFFFRWRGDEGAILGCYHLTECIFVYGFQGLYRRICFPWRSAMVLDHWASQLSEKLHSRTQAVNGGRCINEQRHVNMTPS